MIVRRPGFSTGLHYIPPEIVTDVEFAWLGAVEDETFTVKARSGAAAVTLRYGTDPDLSTYSTEAGTEGNDDVFTFVVTGLTADTEYFFGFAGSSLTGRCRTFPTAGAAADFTIACASCSGSAGADYPGSTTRTSNAPTFDRIRERDPALFIHMGDMHYRDINVDDVSLYRQAYRDVLANSRQHHLYRSVPLAYTWDDHDFGPDDSNKNSPGKAAAQAAYRDYVPHYTLPVSDSIQQQFVIGRVRFILLDVRSYRYPHGATNNASKEMLGTTQKAWLKAQLLAATEPLIVMDVVNSWQGGLDITWSQYAFERRELAEFFEDNSLTERILLINGDNHFIAADDGTHTQFDLDSVNDGPYELNAAPMDAGFTLSTGTWTSGIKKARKQQYGTIAFVDSGTDITATIKGWALSADGTTESELFSLAKVYPG